MQVFEYVPQKTLNLESCVIALGLFDGVHIAHRALLNTAKKIANERSMPFAIFTFSADYAFKAGGSIYSDKEKFKIFESIGADAVIVTQFSSVSGIDAKKFVAECLVKDMNCKVAVLGYDFRFGKGAKGDAALMKNLMKEFGGECFVKEEISFDGEKVSTTKIKQLLEIGDTKKANLLLGEPYFSVSEVVHGDGRGNSLGFPTVNTSFSFDAIKKGVYASTLTVEEKVFGSITNIGHCPTFEKRELHAETFILDANENLYGKTVVLRLLSFIREERAFSDAQDLKEQIKLDVQKAKEIILNGRKLD